jgi:hypothetical protein
MKFLISLIFTLLVFPGAIAGPVIFNGNFVKTLKQNLNLFDAHYYMTGSDDPTSTATNAPLGSIYTNTTTGKVYRKLDAGSSTNWLLVYPQVGTDNFESSPFARSGVNGWALYDDGASATGVDFTGGTVSGVSFSANATSGQLMPAPFRGAYVIDLTAIDAQGIGASKDYVIDDGGTGNNIKDVGRLFLSFVYGSDIDIATGDFILQVYDVDNSSIIDIAGLTDNEIPGVSVNGTGRVNVRIPLESTTDTIRVAIHRAVTTASAGAFYFSDIKLSRERLIDLPRISKWEDYTPQSTSVLNATATIGDSQIKRSTDAADISFNIAFTGTATGSVGIDENDWLPAGLSIDQGKLVNQGSVGMTVGTWTARDSNTSEIYSGNVVVNTNSDMFFVTSSSGYVDATTPFTWASADTIQVKIEDMPITEWANSSALLSTAEAMNETGDFRASSTGAQSISNGTTTTRIFNTVERNELVTYNSATGVGTITSKGRYYFYGNTLMQVSLDAGEGCRGELYINGSAVERVYNFRSGTTATYNCQLKFVSGHHDLNVGDTFSYRVWQNSGGSVNAGTNVTQNYFGAVKVPTFDSNLIYGVFESYEELLSDGQDTTAANTWTDAESSPTQISLGAGEWEIGYSVTVRIRNSSGSAGLRLSNVGLFDSSNSLLGRSIGLARLSIAASGSAFSTITKRTKVTITSATNMKLRIRSDVASADGDTKIIEDITGSITDPDTSNIIWARRLK